MCLSCKKDSKNPSSGSFIPSYALTSYPNHIGDTCYYHKDEMQVASYNSLPAIPNDTIKNSCSFYGTIVSDSILPNGSAGKIWVFSETGYASTIKQLVYYDSVLSSYVITPLLSSFPWPLKLQIPLQQNSTWVNDINSSTDTCKALNAVLFPIKGTQNLAINIRHEFSTNYSYEYYDYTIGDKGFYKIYHEHITSAGGSFSMLIQTITLTKTNF